jgi:ATP-dependent Clp protease ATP-binding subunit ClpA
MTTQQQPDATNSSSYNPNHYSKDVQEIVWNAQLLADEKKHAEMTPMHCFYHLLRHNDVQTALKNLKVSETKAIEELDKRMLDLPLVKTGGEEAVTSKLICLIVEKLQRDSSPNDRVQLDKFFAAISDHALGRPCPEIFKKHIGVPFDKFLNELKTQKSSDFAQISLSMLAEMDKHIGKRMIGQKEAVNAVSRAVKRGKVGLNEPGRPIASMLFLGPSGVGKTELAKTLTEFLYKEEKRLIRFDMSEFMEKHTAQRLIGSPPGYQDSQNGGQLTEAVRKEPACVLLFDEIEKAHTSVFDLFLQMLDDGRLSDSRGNVAYFDKTIIIMTSNIGSKKIIEGAGQLLKEESRDILKETLRHELLQTLRPEFINRIDDITVFSPLTALEIAQIVEIQIRSFSSLMAKKNLTVEFSKEAKNALSEFGFSPASGARELKRIMGKHIRDNIVQLILNGDYSSNDKKKNHIKVGHDGDYFTFA